MLIVGTMSAASRKPFKKVLVANLGSTSYGAENVPAYPQTNTYLYDYLGREFTLGVKVQF